MLLLVRGNLPEASDEEKKKEEEEKKSESSDEDDGFNDERDAEWDKDNNDKLKVPEKKKEKKSPKKKRFDETLQTIQEESEPENTFANTS